MSKKGRFPLIYGADCAVLLGAVPALADVLGGAGLVFIDGHEDATTMEASTTGEAANMEVAFAAPTIADRVRLRPAADLHDDPAEGGRQAAEQVTSQAPGWWLHIDLDVPSRQPAGQP